MNTEKNKPETSFVRWKPIAQAPSLGALIVRCTDGSSRFVMRNEGGFYDPTCNVQMQKSNLVSFVELSDLSDNARTDLKPESFDTLACQMCSTETKPQSVSVSRGDTVSVSYQCSFCGSSWCINDAGEETHFRQGAKKLIGA